MIGHQHLGEFLERLDERISMMEGFFEHNGEVDSAEKLRAIDIQETSHFIQNLDVFFERSYRMMHGLNSHIVSVSRLALKPTQTRALSRDSDNLLRKLYDLTHYCHEVAYTFQSLSKISGGSGVVHHRSVQSAVIALHKLRASIQEVHVMSQSTYTEEKKFWAYLIHLETMVRENKDHLAVIDEALENLGCDKNKSQGYGHFVSEVLNSK